MFFVPYIKQKTRFHIISDLLNGFVQVSVRADNMLNYVCATNTTLYVNCFSYTELEVQAQ